MLTLLQIIQAAAGELGIPEPSIVVGLNSTDTKQLHRLVNSLGRDLQRKYTWQALETEYRFNTQYLIATGTTTAGSAVVTGLTASTGLDSTYAVLGTGIKQDTYVATLNSATQVTLNQAASASGTVALNFCKTKYAFPADYDRPVDRTQWDKSQHWRMLGPVTAQQWQWLKSGYIASGPRVHFRQLGGTLQIWPPRSSADYLGFEYISNAWARTTAGVGKSSFTLDTDICIYPDDLMIKGLKVYYQKAKGLGSDYVDEFNDAISIAFGNDSGSDTLSMCGQGGEGLIGWENIPDSGFGQ